MDGKTVSGRDATFYTGSLGVIFDMQTQRDAAETRAARAEAERDALREQTRWLCVAGAALAADAICTAQPIPATLERTLRRWHETETAARALLGDGNGR